MFGKIFNFIGVLIAVIALGVGMIMRYFETGENGAGVGGVVFIGGAILVIVIIVVILKKIFNLFK